MPDISQFHSRPAKLSCRGEEFFNFITDLRNFGQFVPAGSVSHWTADKSSCSFSMSPVGDISLKISSGTPFTAVSISGIVLATTEFMLHISITEGDDSRAEVILLMEAELNPMMKALVTGPIERFLQTLVAEMENFDGWNSNY